MPYTIALAQCTSLPDISKNLETAQEYIAEAQKKGASLIVFPEYFMYPCTRDAISYVEHAQPVDGLFVHCMKKLAVKYNIWILFGMNEKAPEVNENKCYNTLMILDSSGATRGTYRKTHLFDAFDWQESSHTLAGDSLFFPISTPFGRIGLGICYDLRFPELSRHAALQGAELLIYPSAWMDGPLKALQWKTLISARAIENGITVIGCSQYAKDTFIGQSFACDPFGNTLAYGGLKNELLLVPIEPGRTRDAQSRIPSLSNRRTDLY